MERITLVEIAQERIKEMIVNECQNENGYLPSEGEIAKTFNMSRATIREAVRSMEVRGFLQRIHGKGIKVIDNSEQVLTRSIEDMLLVSDGLFDDLLEMRQMVEPKAAALAAKRATAENIEKLYDYIKIMEESEMMNDSYYDADLAFHMELASASGNQIISSLIFAYTNALRALIVTSNKKELSSEAKFHYHRNILMAVEKRDPKMAQDAMECHLVATAINKMQNK